MFASFLSAVSRVLTDGTRTSILIDVVGHTYGVALVETPDSRTFVVSAASRTCTTVSCTGAAGHILARELRRKGLTRKPKPQAVDTLALLIYNAIRDERERFTMELAEIDAYNEGCGCGACFDCNGGRPNVEREIADLRAALKWGSEHVYAGVCGEDDAAADRLEWLLTIKA